MYISHNEVHPHLGLATPYPDHWTNRDETTSLPTHSLAFLRTDKVCALLRICSLHEHTVTVCYMILGYAQESQC